MRCQQDAKKGFFLNRNTTVFSSRLKEPQDGGKRGWWKRSVLLSPFSL